MSRVRQCDCGDTIAEFAQMHGLSHTTAYRRLRTMGLYPIDLITLPMEELNRLYCNEGKSLRELAVIFQCDPATLRRNLRDYKIPVRNHQEAMGLAGRQKKTARFLHEHSNWRGGRVYPEGYYKAHRWIKTHYGKANKCELNPQHLSTVYDWANISGQCKKDRSDWLMLCHSCHYWFDHPDIPEAQVEELSPDAKKAYLEGRGRRNG